MAEAKPKTGKQAAIKRLKEQRAKFLKERPERVPAIEAELEALGVTEFANKSAQAKGKAAAEDADAKTGTVSADPAVDALRAEGKAPAGSDEDEREAKEKAKKRRTTTRGRKTTDR